MNTQKTKVVVTGGAGMIGSNLAAALLKEDYEVYVIDNLAGGYEKNIPEGAIFHNADVTNLEQIKPIIAGAKFVFHEAALPRVQFSIDHPVESEAVNVGGTRNVLEAAKAGGVEKVIYAASSSAYGDQEQMPLVETMETHPKSPYGEQKLAGEVLCKEYSETHGVPTVCLRYFNVYGPNLDPSGAYALVIGVFLRQKKEGTPLTITGDGTQTRDFTHVRDVVKANILAALSDTVGHGEVINIGFGREVSINELAEMFGGEAVHIDARIEPHRTLADNSKAKELLGWEPKVSLEQGIAELRREWGLIEDPEVKVP